jgi:hypothetical protein
MTLAPTLACLPECTSYLSFEGLSPKEIEQTAIGSSPIKIDEETTIIPTLDNKCNLAVHFKNETIHSSAQLMKKCAKMPQLAKLIQIGDGKCLHKIAQAINYLCFGNAYQVEPHSECVQKDSKAELNSAKLVFRASDKSHHYLVCAPLNGAAEPHWQLC